MLNDSPRNIYDEIPYPSYAFTQSHPDRLAMVATLLGMYPPPVNRCRVLELGCASGGNLIPMAYAFPESEFIGIDLSSREIAEGQATIKSLGLANISLKHLNILEVDSSLGQFDYIIAHGIYSWVPEPVREKMLAICREQLNPNGVAYISYNVYPGWRLLGVVREMMLYHTRHTTDPQAQVAEARDFLEFLTKWIPAEPDTLPGLLHASVNFIKERMPPRQDAYMLHDDLAEVNEPVYFYQFAQAFARHGLRYLSDAQFQPALVSNFDPELAEALRKLAKDTVALEQYQDFLRNRAFRQSLLCHQEAALSARLKPERLAEFHLASPAVPEDRTLEVTEKVTQRFLAPNGSTFTTDHPLTKAAMLCLSEVWPQVVPFNTLLSRALARLGQPDQPIEPQEAQLAGANLLRAFTHTDLLVEFHVSSLGFTLEPGDRPMASAVARLQAQREAYVTNMRHERINLDKSNHRLLPYLDGSRDRVALVDILERWVAEDTLDVEKGGQPVTDAVELRQVLTEMLALKLEQLAHVALLVA